MDRLRQDVLYALRVLGKDRAYAAAVILTLAICLGANTAIFTVVRSVLQRPLPYPDPNRLLSAYDRFPGAGVDRVGTSVPNYVDRRGMTDVFASAALYQWWGYKMGQGPGAENGWEYPDGDDGADRHGEAGAAPGKFRPLGLQSRVDDDHILSALQPGKIRVLGERHRQDAADFQFFRHHGLPRVFHHAL